MRRRDLLRGLVAAMACTAVPALPCPRPGSRPHFRPRLRGLSLHCRDTGEVFDLLPTGRPGEYSLAVGPIAVGAGERFEVTP